MPKHDAADVVAALNTTLPGIMTGPDLVRAEGARLAARHGIKEVGPMLRTLVSDTRRPASVRVTTLRALEAIKDRELETVARKALTDADARLRHEARRILLAKADPQTAVRASWPTYCKPPRPPTSGKGHSRCSPGSSRPPRTT